MLFFFCQKLCEMELIDETRLFEGGFRPFHILSQTTSHKHNYYANLLERQHLPRQYKLRLYIVFV